MRRWTQIFTCQNKKSLVEPNSSDSVAQQKSRGPAKMKESPRLRNLQVSEPNDQKIIISRGQKSSINITNSCDNTNGNKRISGARNPPLIRA